jgi:hypothetical protein
LKGKLRAAHAALRDIKRLKRGHLKSGGVLFDIQEEYEAMIRGYEEELNSLEIDREGLRKEEIKGARRQLLLTERKHLLDSFHQGMLGRRVYERLLEDVDARLLGLEADGGDQEKKS